MSAQQPRRFVLRVPATSANLGPGFDCIGLAIDLWNETVVEIGEPTIRVQGEGAEFLPTDQTNLIASSANSTFQHLDIEPPNLSFNCVNAIPCGGGLGSSSASIVTGIAAAYAVSQRDLDDDQTRQKIFNLAAEIEKHPDNVAPAIFGGCQIGIPVSDKEGETTWQAHRIDIPKELKAVIFLPDFSMKTKDARNLLPSQIQRSDAVFNIGRAALLSYSLSTGKWDLLRNATQDRLHQPLRVKKLFPRFTPIANAALDAGAHGVFLSGAGPAIMALASQRHMTICYEMTEAARKTQTGGNAVICDLSNLGLHIRQ